MWAWKRCFFYIWLWCQSQRAAFHSISVVLCKKVFWRHCTRSDACNEREKRPESWVFGPQSASVFWRAHRRLPRPRLRRASRVKVLAFEVVASLRQIRAFCHPNWSVTPETCNSIWRDVARGQLSPKCTYGPCCHWRRIVFSTTHRKISRADPLFRQWNCVTS